MENLSRFYREKELSTSTHIIYSDTNNLCLTLLKVSNLVREDEEDQGSSIFSYIKYCDMKALDRREWLLL